MEYTQKKGLLHHFIYVLLTYPNLPQSPAKTPFRYPPPRHPTPQPPIKPTVSIHCPIHCPIPYSNEPEVTIFYTCSITYGKSNASLASASLITLPPPEETKLVA